MAARVHHGSHSNFLKDYLEANWRNELELRNVNIIMRFREENGLWIFGGDGFKCLFILMTEREQWKFLL